MLLHGSTRPLAHTLLLTAVFTLGACASSDEPGGGDSGTVTRTDAATTADASTASDAGTAVDGSIEPGGRCTPVRFDSVRTPTTSRHYQRIPFTAVAEQINGCGCEIRVQQSGTAMNAFACNCCEVCDCAETGAAVHGSFEPSTAMLPSNQTYTFGGLPASVTIYAEDTRSSNAGLVVDALEILPQPQVPQTEGDKITWARVRGRAPRCCGTPEIVTSVSMVVAVLIEAWQVDVGDCDACPGTPPLREWEVQVALGTFPAGRRVEVNSGMVHTEFVAE